MSRKCIKKYFNFSILVKNEIVYTTCISLYTAYKSKILKLGRNIRSCKQTIESN